MASGSGPRKAGPPGEDAEQELELNDEEDYEVVDLGEKGDGEEDEEGDLAQEEFEDQDAEEQDLPEVSAGPDVSVRSFRGHSKAVYSLALSPDGHTILTGSGDDTAVAFDLRTCETLHTLRGHTDTINCVGISSDGKFFATGGMDSAVIVWDAATGNKLHTAEGPGAEIEWLSWHSRGAALLAGSADGNAWMWGVTQSAAKFMQIFSGHEGSVPCGGYSPSGKSVITGGADSTVRVMNPNTGAATVVFQGHGWCEGPVTSVCMQSADAPVLCATSQDGTARIANVATGKALLTLAHDPGAAATEEEEGNTSVESAAFSSVQNWLASGATDATLKIWDVSLGAPRSTLLADGGIIKVKWVEGQPHLLAASTASGSVQVWDSRNAKLAKLFTGHAGMVFDFVIAGNNVVTSGDDSVVRVFDFAA